METSICNTYFMSGKIKELKFKKKIKKITQLGPKYLLVRGIFYPITTGNMAIFLMVIKIDI